MRQFFPSSFTRKDALLLVSVGVLTAGLTACSGASSPVSSSPSISASAMPTSTSRATPMATPTASATPLPTASSSASPGGTTVNLQVLNARLDSTGNTITVAAMITDRISNAGHCSLTVVAAGQTHRTEGPAMADASVTYCGTLSVALPQGEIGPWDYTVEYTEAGYRGVFSGVVASN